MEATRLHQCWQLLRYLGPKWLTYRLYYAALKKTKLIQRRHPATSWTAQSLARFVIDSSLADPKRYAKFRQSSAPRFFFEPDSAADFRSELAAWDTEETSPLSTAKDVGNGKVQFFSNELVNVGLRPHWHKNPFTSMEYPSDQHWSEIDDFDSGDIKLVWELSRFSFTYPLVRAYWRTGNEQYAEVFWNFAESWHEANPPESGVNWKCGQEISLRVMAWCFGLYGFGANAASTPSRVAMLSQMIAVSGRHIESNIAYGLSQKNNHGLSEAMGLWTIGSLFPEFIDSKRWQERGRRFLERQANELIYDDGAFSQHSMNYHRLMLHDYLWSLRLGDVLGRPFSNRLRERIGKASEFAYQLQDNATGMVPCYGQDDGALVLPLNNCDYRDYRPVIQASHYLVNDNCRLPAGPWDEDLFWLFGVINKRDRSLPTTSLVRSDFDAPIGGYTTLRASNGFAVARAATFRHRPSQADMLNVDVWWRGQNIAIDPGTYSYNAAAPWDNPFSHTSCHNTVTVDGLDQMSQVGRFLWLPWVQGKSFGRDVCCRGDASGWNGEHDGYRRLPDPITHRRGVVRIGADHWLIIDSLYGRHSHHYRLHWLLIDAPYRANLESSSIELRTEMGTCGIAMATSEPISTFCVTRAASNSAIGWRSTRYHSKEPAVSISLECDSPSVVFATLLGPDAKSPVIQKNQILACGVDWDALVSLSAINIRGVPLVSSIDVRGSLAECSPSISPESSWPKQEPLPCTSC